MSRWRNLCMNFRRKNFPRSASRCTENISFSFRSTVIRPERPNTPTRSFRPSSHFLPSVPRSPSAPPRSSSSHAFDRARFTVDKISLGKGANGEHLHPKKRPAVRQNGLRLHFRLSSPSLLPSENKSDAIFITVSQKCDKEFVINRSRRARRLALFRSSINNRSAVSIFRRCDNRFPLPPR